MYVCVFISLSDYFFVMVVLKLKQIFEHMSNGSKGGEYVDEDGWERPLSHSDD